MVCYQIFKLKAENQSRVIGGDKYGIYRGILNSFRRKEEL
jgi:hypothetical protein